MNLSPAHEARLEFEAMVEQHRPLAHHLASRYRHTGEPFDDLLQTACEGLVKAVHRFEPDRGIPFSTFAVPTILGELRRHFRDRTWAMRVPRRLQELALKLDRATDELTAALGRRPTAAELATRLLGFHDDLTQSEIAARMGCSQVQVSCVLRNGVEQLRCAAGER